MLSVADDFGVPPDKLRRWNHLKGNQLRKGRMLVIYKPLGPGEAEPLVAGHHRKGHQTARKSVHSSKKNVKARTSHSPAQRSSTTLAARGER